MSFTAYFNGLLALIALGIGLRASLLWLDSTKIPVVPAWPNNGTTEPGDSELSMMGWIVGQLNANERVSKVNARAAKWTAAAVVVSGISGVLGAWPS